jgi:NAD/NADP transhydrogenase beta subunit
MSLMRRDKSNTGTTRSKVVVQSKGLREVTYLAKLMDSQFRIPGTNFRFGLDGIIGLIPGAGDLSTFAVSGYMLWIMARNGASGFVLSRMVVNVLIDAIIGSIPFIGDLFDFVFKANTRNLRLMQEHYQEGRHKGSAWRVIVPILIILFLVIAALIWLAYKLIAGLFHWGASL